MAVLLLCLGVGVYIYYFAYGRTAMVLDIVYAEEYLWRARASVDLDEMAEYMQKSNDALRNRSGNPNWLWHTPDTDFDLIKSTILTNRESALNVSRTEPKGSYGYQRAIDNIQEACVELNEHLDCTIDWCTNLLPSTIILNAIGWVVFIVCVILYLVWAA